MSRDLLDLLDLRALRALQELRGRPAPTVQRAQPELRVRRDLKVRRVQRALQAFPPSFKRGRVICPKHLRRECL